MFKQRANDESCEKKKKEPKEKAKDPNFREENN